MKKIILLILFSVAIYFFLHSSSLSSVLKIKDVSMLANYLQGLGWYGVFISFMLIMVQTYFPFIPFVVLAGANTIVFGYWHGFLLSYLFAVLGAIISFYFNRYFFREWAEKRITKYQGVEVWEQKISEKGFIYILLARLIPILPSGVVNLLAALTKISGISFMMATVIGKFPMVWLESTLGYDLINFHKEHKSLFFLSLLFLILIYIGKKLHKKILSNKS